MPDQPALVPWYRLIQEPDRVLLEHAGRLVCFEGKATQRLLPALLALLDGSKRYAEIVDALGPAIEPSIRNALELLAANELLIDGPVPADAPSSQAAAFAAAGPTASSPELAHAALAASRVGVTGSSPAAGACAELLRATVGEVALCPFDAEPAADLVLVAPSAAETPRLDELNRRRLRDGLPWLLVLPHDGRFVGVGPLFVPNETACWSCYRLRRGANSEYEDDFDVVESAPTRAASPPALTSLAGALAALLVVRRLVGRDPYLLGRFYALETGPVLGLTLHDVLRVPRCPVCGPLPTPLPSPWYLETASDR